jgi:CHRD domain
MFFSSPIVISRTTIGHLKRACFGWMGELEDQSSLLRDQRFGSPQAGSKVNSVAILKFNPSEGKIDVTIDVAGLPPKSIHPAHIHTGNSCNANGPILYPFLPLKADAAGVAHEKVTIPAQSIPATGWYINVHMGPDLVGAHGTPIGCGVVARGL